MDSLTQLTLGAAVGEAVGDCETGWRNTVIAAVRAGLPAPALSSALSYYDGYHAAALPASLVQAQRDFFGAHRYERIDRPRGETFHTEWE